MLSQLLGFLFTLTLAFTKSAKLPEGFSSDLNKTLDVDDLIGRLVRQDCEKPNCKGVGCGLITETKKGCQICACPIGSRARGCDRMPFALWSDILQFGCPDDSPNGGEMVRTPVAGVVRWYRKINKRSGQDECASYSFPYCEGLDFNLWRSPRTPEECLQECYTPTERLHLAVVFQRPQNLSLADLWTDNLSRRRFRR